MTKWATNFGGEYFSCAQNELTGNGKNTKLNVAIKKGEENIQDVRGGICGQMVRMFLWLRNVDFVSVEPDNKNSRETMYIRAKIDTLMWSQAMMQAGLNNKVMSDIAGLAVDGGFRNHTHIKQLVTVLLHENGMLSRVGVDGKDGNEEYTHAMAFDSRGNEFHFFDPNQGHFKCSKQQATQEKLTEYLTGYFEYQGYLSGSKHKIRQLIYRKAG